MERCIGVSCFKKEENGDSPALHKNGRMQEWRIIFSHEFSESHLSSRPPVNLGRTVTFEAPASIILDKFYSGVPPEHIGAKTNALEKAWLQLAPRLVPDAIALRCIFGYSATRTFTDYRWQRNGKIDVCLSSSVEI